MATLEAPAGWSETRARPSFGLAQIEVYVFRSARDVRGPQTTIGLEPDFEGVAGHSHKPERGWRRFAARPAAELLVRAAALAFALGRER